MTSKPLTAAQLADALGYFSNTAISAMHCGTADVACIAQGIDAVASRLAEIAVEAEIENEPEKPVPASRRPLPDLGHLTPPEWRDEMKTPAPASPRLPAEPGPWIDDNRLSSLRMTLSFCRDGEPFRISVRELRMIAEEIIYYRETGAHQK